jgi:tRNA (guanine-N7-)-methyltransferase
VELGCADAQFLFERARVDPTRVYIGIEIRDQLVDWVNRQARDASAPVQAVFAHANRHLAELFPPASVDRAYLNFPDPWFKRRHRKRRMIDDALARGLARILAPNGVVMVQTDVWGIALDAIEVFERAHADFENNAGPWSFWKAGNPFGARSLRERYCEEDGIKVWRLVYRRRARLPQQRYPTLSR